MRIVAAIAFFSLILIRLIEGGIFPSDPTPESSPANIAGITQDSAMESDLSKVDAFLADWDWFAQGENELVAKLQQAKPEFDAALIRLFNHGDRGAPARLVFYAVVQIGGTYKLDSALGRAATPVLGENFPITMNEDGDRVIFAGDLYFWWQQNKESFQSFPLFEAWQQREFAQSMVIPLYENSRKENVSQ